MCCLQELRWRGQGSRMLGMKGRRYKLQWSGKGDGVGGIEVMMEKLVEVRRISDSDDCYGFLRCAEVHLWVYSAKWKMSGRKTVLW